MPTYAFRPFLRVLCNLRWLAIAGQVATVWVVVDVMRVPLLQPPLWAGIAALALFNAYVSWRIRSGPEPRDGEIFAHLLVDIAALTWMIGWSGGVENPFSSLFLLPIALSVLALPGRWIWAIAAASVIGYGVSALLARPLPHLHGGTGEVFDLHKAGMLVNFLVSVIVVLVFFARMHAAARESARRIARLQERFARNEGIVALATHAASVAHELNTPLGTLMLMVEDLASEPGNDARREELATMRALLEVCRDRVRALASPADARHGQNESGADVERSIERWRLVRPTVELRRTGSLADVPRVDPAVAHLIQALLNNAADASEQAGSTRIDLHVEPRGPGMRAVIRDYGTGLGLTEPVLPGTLFRTSKPWGMGIGLALSHATVERLGGTLSMQAANDGPGIVVAFELPTTAVA